MLDTSHAAFDKAAGKCHEKAAPNAVWSHDSTRYKATTVCTVVKLYTDTPIDLKMKSFSKRPGPCLLLTAAIHGDELNGEVCQILGSKHLNKLAGTLIVIPVVNMLGFIHQTRYLPDRRI